MSPPLTVNVARAYAELAHDGQFYGDQPYIDHVTRVGHIAAHLAATDPRLNVDTCHIVGLLHDIMEDTDVNEADLYTLGANDDVVQAVLALTHTPGQPRRDYLQMVCANPIAVCAKLADTIDNSHPQRNMALGNRDPQRAARLRTKYDDAYHQLSAVAPAAMVAAADQYPRAVHRFAA